MHTPKVSVIIPIYNVEPYIERCIRSLFEQTLESMEYIFINDYTPDNSMEILKNVLMDYPKRIEQIKIINQPHNKGAAKAREDGIKAATGEYIIHCDSDDWVDKNMYQQMYDKACGDGLNMVICDWYETDGEYNEPVQQNLNTNTNLLSGIIKRSISGSLCNKLIARSIYKKLEIYPTEHMMEDVVYSVQLIAKCSDKIGFLAKPFYYYYKNDNSICRQSSDEYCIARCKQACVNIDAIISFLQKHQLEKQFINELVALKNSARVFLWPLLLKDHKKYRRMWISVYPEINKQYPFTKGITLNLRIIFCLAIIGVYPYVYQIIKKINIKINDLE